MAGLERTLLLLLLLLPLVLEQVLFEVAGVGVGALAHRANVHRAVVVYVPVAVAADSIFF